MLLLYAWLCAVARYTVQIKILNGIVSFAFNEWKSNFAFSYVNTLNAFIDDDKTMEII